MHFYNKNKIKIYECQIHAKYKNSTFKIKEKMIIKKKKKKRCFNNE